MKLIVKCKNCRKEIKLKNSVNDRAELARERGNEFRLKCKECLKENIFQVNEVTAKEGKLINLTAVIFLVFGTLIVGYLLRNYLLRPSNPYVVLAVAGVLLIPSAIYAIITKQESDNSRRFNRYKI